MAICQYQAEEPKNIETSTTITAFKRTRHAFLKSKMASLQSYSNKHGIKNAMIWTEIRSTTQIRHCNNHLTLSKRKNENFQSTKKVCVNAYFLLSKTFP